MMPTLYLCKRFRLQQCASVPQCVGGDGHYAFWALLGGKARGILQSLI